MAPDSKPVTAPLGPLTFGTAQHACCLTSSTSIDGCEHRSLFCRAFLCAALILGLSKTLGTLFYRSTCEIIVTFAYGTEQAGLCSCTILSCNGTPPSYKYWQCPSLAELGCSRPQFPSSICPHMLWLKPAKTGAMSSPVSHPDLPVVVLMVVPVMVVHSL